MTDNKMSWSTFKDQFLWRRKMDEDEVYDLGQKIFNTLKRGGEYDNKYIYSDLVYTILPYLNIYNNFDKLWRKVLKDHFFVGQAKYYKPINANDADKDNFKNNIDVPYKEKDVRDPKWIFVDTSGKENDNSKYYDMINNLDDKEPDIQEPDDQQPEGPQKPSKNSGNKTGGKKSEPVHPKLTKEQKEALKLQALANALREPSWTDQIKGKITAIAKDKSLMSLSKDQFQDYLKTKLHIDDKNIDDFTEAVVAKRAELLANKQLNREQLTDADVEKLQEQSQRDFERKLHDQNLRYLLPAMLEKRDRLVVNRLNPNLLKGGY